METRTFTSLEAAVVFCQSNPGAARVSSDVVNGKLTWKGELKSIPLPDCDLCPFMGSGACDYCPNGR